MSCDRMLSCCSDAGRVNSLPIKSHVARHSPKSNILCIDGVYAPGLHGKPEFFALRPPENAEVAELAQAMAQRVRALLKRRGLNSPQPDTEDSDPLSRDQPWLAEVYAGSICGRLATGVNAGRRVVLAGDRINPEAIDSRTGPRAATTAS